jgi:hypothetical protein
MSLGISPSSRMWGYGASDGGPSRDAYRLRDYECILTLTRLCVLRAVAGIWPYTLHPGDMGM